MNIRVAIFEDDKMASDAIQTMLISSPGFTCCGVFEDANRWESNIKYSEPDVILMSIEIFGLTGIEVIKKIYKRFPHIKIVIQAVLSDPEKIFFALCAGASGYISKNNPPNKSIIKAITSVYNGGTPISSAVAKKLLGFFANQNLIFVPGGKENYHLSERENQILLLMAEKNNCKTIAEKTFISYQTVRTHVKNIYKKLHVSSRSEAVIKAINKTVTFGYVAYNAVI
jgi:DNA-binding NarL/FixJ family response regulator